MSQRQHGHRYKHRLVSSRHTSSTKATASIPPSHINYSSVRLTEAEVALVTLNPFSKSLKEQLQVKASALHAGSTSAHQCPRLCPGDRGGRCATCVPLFSTVYIKSKLPGGSTATNHLWSTQSTGSASNSAKCSRRQGSISVLKNPGLASTAISSSVKHQIAECFEEMRGGVFVQ